MPKPYSIDFRSRVIADVETGASRREAAERYGISPSVVVIWTQRFEATGSVAAKPSGGSTSPLEDHAEFLLGLIADKPDLTLDEIVAAMNKRRIAGSRSAVWRFFDRRNFSFKKTLYAAEQKRADVARARRRWMREQGMFDPARLVFIDETSTNTAMVRLRGRAPRGERLVDYAPHGHWKTITFVGGLRQRGMTASFVIEGAMNGPIFLAYVTQCLVPTLKRGEIVLMDNLPVHKVAGVAEAIEGAGATLIYLPKYSPDLNPIELPSANSRRICARRPSARSRTSCVGSVALLPISARKNAGISFAMRATFEHDRNPL
jgi:transposase